MPSPTPPVNKCPFRLATLNGNYLPFRHNAFALFISLSFFFALPSALYPQPYLFDARMLTAEDGLSNLTVSSVYKDKQGFIWIGNLYGLDRYDGYNFKLFTREESALYPHSYIARIAEDEEGRLWLFYRNGNSIPPSPEAISAIDIFDPKTGRAVPFDAFFSGAAPFSTADVYFPKILDPRNRLWIHTNKGELFLYQNGRFKKVFQMEGAFFQYITIDEEENIWLGWKNNLLAIDLSGNVLEKRTLPGQVLGAWAGPDGAIWISTQDTEDKQAAIWRRPETGPLIPFNLVRDNRPVEVEEVHPFLHLNQNGYWFAIIEGQLNLFGPQGNWLYNYSDLLGQPLIEVSSLSYFEDVGLLWLPSATGVFKASIRPNPFQIIHKKDTILSDCRGIAEDEQGNIYFLNSYLYQWNSNTRKCTKISDIEGAYALLYTDSMLWSGSYGGDIAGCQFSLRSNEKTYYMPLNPDGHLALSLAPTGRPHQYLAGFNVGLACLDLEQQKLLSYEEYDPNYKRDSVLEQSEVDFIHKNAFGYWLATNNGIFLLKEGKGVIRHYDRSNGSLPFNHIRHIHEDEEGAFWLASKGGGVIRWRPQLSQGEAPSSYQQFTTKDGLADNFTYAVYEDDYGKLWIPSDKGLMQMDKASFRTRTFTTDDGLSHNEFNFSAHYQARDGTLYFGGLGGLIAFHPRVFTEEKANHTPLAFTNYYVLEEGADKMADKTQLLQAGGAIIIQPGDKFFELHFALLDFDAPEQHRYAYQIQGYSDSWNYTNENFIRITNLPFGKYTLEIQGQNSSRGWSNQTLSLSIQVLKPFYLQWWFIAMVITGIVSVTLAAVRWRIVRLQKDRARLEAEVQKRTRQIEEDKQTIAAQAEALQELDRAKSRFFSNITHEFRTPLTLIIGPLEQALAENPPPSILRRRMQGVIKNARHILGLINQLLDLSKMESGRMEVEAVRGDIIAYTRELAMQFQPLAGKKALRLHFISDQGSWEANFDQDKWDKIVYNLLSNAIKFTPQGNAIQLSLARVGDDERESIRLDVKDTGMGIDEKQIERVFDRFYQAPSPPRSPQGGAGTGIGLALVKELVELQGGKVSVASEVGKGTSFCILLPVLSAENIKPLAGQPTADVLSSLELAANEAASEAKAPAEDNKEKLELLIIEDNEEMREYIRYCIGEDKYHITEATDGQEGIEKAQALIPDLIISDVMMPKKDGLAVTQAIRSSLSTSHIPLILLTAKASLESRLEGLQRGADAYLTKPFSPQELALRTEKLIEIRRMLQQRYQNVSPTDEGGAYRQEDEFITELRAYVLEHIDDADLNGDRIGRHFGMSRVHLYRKLKALTDQSITEFVKAVRLQKALELVREGKYNVSEIAYQTGFSSVSHFSRSFKQAFGKAPSEV